MAAHSSEEQLLSGQAWADFCETLKRSGQQILRAEAPSDALTRTEGFRYLSRLLRIALEMHVEFADVGRRLADGLSEHAAEFLWRRRRRDAPGLLQEMPVLVGLRDRSDMPVEKINDRPGRAGNGADA